MTLKPGGSHGRFKRNFIYRHHIEPRVPLYVPKEETFPIPPKYIDVTTATYTNLDVLQEKRIDDYWNVERESKFIRFLERIHKVHFFCEKNLQRDTCGLGGPDKNSSNHQT